MEKKTIDTKYQKVPQKLKHTFSEQMLCKILQFVFEKECFFYQAHPIWGKWKKNLRIGAGGGEQIKVKEFLEVLRIELNLHL